MPIYAVQDSDWDYNNEEYPAVIVEADTPKQAAETALSLMEECDGAHLKIAELKTIGFIGWYRDDGFDKEVDFIEEKKNDNA